MNKIFSIFLIVASTTVFAAQDSSDVIKIKVNNLQCHTSSYDEGFGRTEFSSGISFQVGDRLNNLTLLHHDLFAQLTGLTEGDHCADISNLIDSSGLLTVTLVKDVKNFQDGSYIETITLVLSPEISVSSTVDHWVTAAGN